MAYSSDTATWQFSPEVALSLYSTIPIAGIYILLCGIRLGFNCYLSMKRTVSLSGGKNAFQQQPKLHTIRGKVKHVFTPELPFPGSPWPLIPPHRLLLFQFFPVSDSSLPLHLLLSRLCKSGGYLMIYLPSSPIFRVAGAIRYKLSM